MKHARGNALFLILIAVALFAALSYAVTQSGRGGSSVDREQLALSVSKLQQHFSSIQYELDKMSLLNGVQNDGYDLRSSGGWVHRCSDPTLCAVFERGGGPISNTISVNSSFNREGSGCGSIPLQRDTEPVVVRVRGVGQDNVGDIVLRMFCVSEQACREYNKSIGLSNTFPLDTSLTEDYNFFGVPADQIPEPTVAANSDIGDEVAELAGKTTFCYRNGFFSGEEARIIWVLIPR